MLSVSKGTALIKIRKVTMTKHLIRLERLLYSKELNQLYLRALHVIPFGISSDIEKIIFLVC